jgi:hypothetical protein
MALAAILIGTLPVLAAWMAYRRPASPKPAVETRSASQAEPAGSAIDPSQIDASRVEAASKSASQRLWRLAFGAPSQMPPLDPAHIPVRDLIYAVLQVDILDPSYFPRRPALMPQLMQAVNDPAAASDTLSRMIARDPVLAADVLRLANSSLYRVSPEPIKTIQQAVVVCGVDSLRGILAVAMLRPVFRASRSNFPRLPRMLWERTERAARAAELYAAKLHPQDRFEAQFIVLLSALGPLVVYSAALDGYSRAPTLSPNPALFVELIDGLAPRMSQRIARDWETPPRFQAAFDTSGGELLATALHVGELLGTLSFLESQTVISSDERQDVAKSAGLPGDLVDGIWARLAVGPEDEEAS